MKLQNYAENQWIEGADDGKPLASAVDGRTVAMISSARIDFGAMLRYARETGLDAWDDALGTVGGGIRSTTVPSC